VGNGTDDEGGDRHRHPGQILPDDAGWDAGLNDHDAWRLARLIDRANIEGPSHLIVAQADLLWLVNWAGELMVAQTREIPEMTISDEEYRAVVGRNIARARRQVQVSQRQLAEHLDVSRTAVSDYEHARRALSLEALRAIAGGLRVPIGLLAQDWEVSPYLLVPVESLQPRPPGAS
jgi:DNA-binding XRE family transcriptional regulator